MRIKLIYKYVLAIVICALVAFISGCHGVNW